MLRMVDLVVFIKNGRDVSRMAGVVPLLMVVLPPAPGERV